MNHPEEQTQIALFQWAKLEEPRFPELRLLFHIPNGGKRTKVEAARFKAAGTKAGVPDLFLPVPRAEYHGLFVELKAGKNRPTEAQREWLTELGRMGYRTAVCYSLDEAIREIKGYLKLQSEKGNIMSKYKKGDTVDIRATLRITNAHERKSGETVYQFDKGFALTESALEKIAPDTAATEDKAERERLRRQVCDTGALCLATIGGRKRECPLFRMTDGFCTPYVAAHPETKKMLVDYLKAEKCDESSEKPAPIKLYCVRDNPGWLTKGKIYEYTPDKPYSVTYDNGFHGYAYTSLKEFHRHCPQTGAPLWPLVHRHAKVGEYVLSTEDCCGEIRNNTVFICKEAQPNGNIRVDGLNEKFERGNNIGLPHYLVLDGYNG